MLTEDDVVEAACRYLGTSGYRVIQRCATTQRGEDIVATDETGTTIHVEAKGETSNRATSARFGKPFSRSQCSDHVANAFYTVSAIRSSHPNDRVAMAFPDTPLHREYIGRIDEARRALRIEVFWVDPDHGVSFDSYRSVELFTL